MKPSEIVDHIEQKLKEKGLSKSAFYEATGISAAVFSNWRKEKNRPSLDNLDAINAYLGTTFGIELENEKKLAQMDEQTADIMFRILALSDQKLKALLTFLDTLEELP